MGRLRVRERRGGKRVKGCRRGGWRKGLWHIYTGVLSVLLFACTLVWFACLFASFLIRLLDSVRWSSFSCCGHGVALDLSAFPFPSPFLSCDMAWGGISLAFVLT